MGGDERVLSEPEDLRRMNRKEWGFGKARGFVMFWEVCALNFTRVVCWDASPFIQG